MKSNWISKLTSRKFWLALAAFAVGVLALLGVGSNLTQQISGVIMSLGAVIAYIAGEGYVDGQSAANTTGAQIATTQPPAETQAATADTAAYTAAK